MGKNPKKIILDIYIYIKKKNLKKKKKKIKKKKKKNNKINKI